ncbi:alpha/beta hydrolase-fold protein [uncultured Dokdonia sp.]|uniref:alpha/beta hydrolase-fold protein n=1 Tax=uncultured Dokdonia sp. TaxID=575653 RepID=UPI0026060546|nr:alpha/beta hydrolase-fold protein [uncultured Dokdonia sp.]
MTRILVCIGFICINFCAIAQFSHNDKKQIVIGTVDSLFSKTLNEQREIWVHLPEKIEDGDKYPVIYVLDGTDHFYTVTGMLKLLEKWDVPKSIIVGISNTDRTRDFTPTHVPFQRGHTSETSGGAANFMTFIEKELQPYVNSKYPTDTMSTIIGHSTGGLFVLYTYMHHPEVFDHYLAIDPSLWWDKENLVNESKALFNSSTHQNKSLYIAVANSTGIDTTKVRKLKSEPTEMLRANLNFHDILVKNKSDVEFTWDYQGNEDHGSVVVPGLYNGLRSLFSWYPFPERWRFNTPKAYSAEELTVPFYTHFEEVSKRFKREVKPKWQFINDVGFFILTSHKSPKKAQAYLEMNLKFYPKESRSYVAMGDYYTLRKKKDEAIHYFEKAIEIDGNKEAQEKLKKLNK